MGALDKRKGRLGIAAPLGGLVMRIKYLIRKYKKTRRIRWMKRYSDLMYRFYRMVYGGKMTKEWVNRRQRQLERLAILKALSV